MKNVSQSSGFEDYYKKEKCIYWRSFILIQKRLKFYLLLVINKLADK